MDRVLAAAVAGGFFLLGVAELITRLDEPAPLLFWLPTLWGGSALVLIGAFRMGHNRRLAKILILVGSVLGLPASAWTLLMPILILALIVRVLLIPASSG
ncbi:MAG TPA: hypothetical protein VJ935_00205 [Acidimicrobiia bacterium]|nr:hypothetical protein [Acidimicrobiia bacterium]